MADESIGKEGVLSWTDERVELLRKLWLEGLSASRIATELAGGVTRNAVIGKVHRLGMSGRVKASAPAGGRTRPMKAASDQSRQPIPQRTIPLTMPSRGNVALAMHPHSAPVPQPIRGENNVISMTDTVTIMDLRESMCRWPVGDPSSSEFRYCGGKAPIGGGPYCAAHSRMAYQPAQDRRVRKIA